MWLRSACLSVNDIFDATEEDKKLTESGTVGYVKRREIADAAKASYQQVSVPSGEQQRRTTEKDGIKPESFRSDPLPILLCCRLSRARWTRTCVTGPCIMPRWTSSKS